ncbi:MAG: hypothetical protein JSR33_05675 [Proteobacteria bacterium]|nr:hypothetical protein [Pseudomonadota bacterium]
MKNFYRMGVLVLLLMLTACSHTEEETGNPVKKSAEVCEMLRPKITADNYRVVDPVTGKRKNIVDQAVSIKDYDAYSCPEIVDKAPPPTETIP